MDEKSELAFEKPRKYEVSTWPIIFKQASLGEKASQVN